MLKSVRSRVGIAALLCCILVFPSLSSARQDETEPTDADIASFARCISDSGAKFYGAHWCGFCAAQKEMFGEAAASLPYIECYAAGTRDKLKQCGELSRFPLWVYGPMRLGRGLQSFGALSRATGCPAP